MGEETRIEENEVCRKMISVVRKMLVKKIRSGHEIKEHMSLTLLFLPISSLYPLLTQHAKVLPPKQRHANLLL